MKSFAQWRGAKLYREFNGPAGQPDPAGVSSPVLAPQTAGSPSQAGARPGMASAGESPAVSRAYQQLLAALKQQQSAQQTQWLQRLQTDLSAATPRY